MPEDRRHIAVMFTDIVGYTALMGSDEDKAFEMLKRNHTIHETLIKKHNGTLIKEVGDGTLASFPLASDAVRCALDIQKEAKSQQIPLKIGIHEGEMVMADEDVLGDGVNVASRLQEISADGSITISGRVYSDVKNKTGIKTKFIGDKRLKNVDDPVKVYEVVCEELVIKKPTINQVFGKSKIRLLYYIIPGLVLIIAATLIWQLVPTTETSPTNREASVDKEISIAVLPFDNLSGDPDQEVMCDGLTEEIIHHLSTIEDFNKVISRNSIMTFKDTYKKTPEIAEELGVNILLEGSYRQSGNRLRITVQLIEAESDKHLWSEIYENPIGDIFDIQTDIAQKIAQELKKILSPEEIEKIGKKPTENLEAYNLYLKGRYFWNKRTAPGFQTGIEYFHQAIEKDPTYSLAYAGISDCYNLLGWHDLLPPEEVYPKAKAAAEKALMMDETLSQAHASLAYVKMLYDWDWNTAEREFKRALDLNPNYAEAHQWYSEYLAYIGRYDESIREAKRAQELDPLSLSINHNLGLVFYEAHQFDLAIEKYQKVLQMDPSFIVTYNYLGLAYAGKKMYNDAISKVQMAIDLTEKQSPLYVGTLAFIYASLGNTVEAEEVLEHLLELSQHRYIAPVSLAIIYGAMGQMDQAFDWMEKGYKVRDDFMMTLKTEPRLNSLRSDPRFQDLLERMNFPD